MLFVYVTVSMREGLTTAILLYHVSYWSCGRRLCAV
jgi:hypothetical protein